MGASWKTKRVTGEWKITAADGDGAEVKFIHDVTIFIAKRRWAAKAREEAEKAARMVLSIDIPGTNLVVLLSPVVEPKTIWFTDEFIKSQREYNDELAGILDVPIEEADGTTVAEKRPARKRGSDA